MGAAWSAAASGGAVWRGQRHRWSVDGDEVAVDLTSRGELDVTGRMVGWTRWRDGAQDGSWRGGPAWWLDQAADAGTLPVGPVTALHTGRQELLTVEVTGTGGSRSWTVDGLATEVTLGPEGPVQRWGRLERRPVAAEPDLAPVDPVALVWRSSAPYPKARAARWSRWRVGEAERVVEVPLRLEVPRATLREIEGLVREVRRRVAFAVDLSPADPVAALATGRGDCDQQAAVLVSLARERGFVARPVAGVVYAESARGSGLELHAWAELDLPGLGWVAVDPALDQALADATHLSLATDAAAYAAAGVLANTPRLELSEIR